MNVSNYIELFDKVESGQDLARFADALADNYPVMGPRIYELMFEYHDISNLGTDPLNDVYSRLSRLAEETVKQSLMGGNQAQILLPTTFNRLNRQSHKDQGNENPPVEGIIGYASLGLAAIFRRLKKDN